MRSLVRPPRIELASTGELEGLSKKEAKQRTSQRARELSVQLAEQIAASLQSTGAFATVEAANGYVNISFDPMVVASGLVSEVLTRERGYGTGTPKTERVMVEHSQPNTHKVFHVGHLRNSVLGVSVSRIMGAAGYPVMEATYPGDIGMTSSNASGATSVFILDKNQKTSASGAPGSGRSMSSPMRGWNTART